MNASLPVPQRVNNRVTVDPVSGGKDPDAKAFLQDFASFEIMIGGTASASAPERRIVTLPIAASLCHTASAVIPLGISSGRKILKPLILSSDIKLAATTVASARSAASWASADGCAERDAVDGAGAVGAANGLDEVATEITGFRPPDFTHSSRGCGQKVMFN
jgi:hypothetical protein